MLTHLWSFSLRFSSSIATARRLVSAISAAWAAIDSLDLADEGLNDVVAGCGRLLRRGLALDGPAWSGRRCAVEVELSSRVLHGRLVVGAAGLVVVVNEDAGRVLGHRFELDLSEGPVRHAERSPCQVLVACGAKHAFSLEAVDEERSPNEGRIGRRLR